MPGPTHFAPAVNKQAMSLPIFVFLVTMMEELLEYNMDSSIVTPILHCLAHTM
jgi:hypothetical protein